MFSTILKILPQLDQSDLNKMDRQLSGRFKKVAKSFGSGLASALKGGAVGGAIFALVNKLLNPLKEIQEILDKTLNTSDDIATYATQFGTTSGRLAKLLALGQSTGLQDQDLYMLLMKYQTALAEANSDPSKPSPVAQFKNDTDIASSFFEFIQAMQKMNSTDQILVQQQVFGEKQILKMSEFLNADFAKLTKRFADINTGAATTSINKLAANSDELAVLRARNNLKDFTGKSNVITSDMISAQARSEAEDKRIENERLQGYQNLKSLDDTVKKLMALVEEILKIVAQLLKFIIPFINSAIKLMKDFSKSSWLRKILGD